jgi:hypothetical protein
MSALFYSAQYNLQAFKFINLALFIRHNIWQSKRKVRKKRGREINEEKIVP